MTLLAVLLAGAVGALGRHLLVVGLAGARHRRLPVGLLAANVGGSLLLGALVGARIGGHISALALTVLGAGFCGALTSWSSLTVDLSERIEAGDHLDAAATVAVSLVLGGAAAALGAALTGGS